MVDAATPLVRRLAWSALVLQVLLIVSGTSVRVTNSGLGCPTWPRCSGGSVITTPALGIHGDIEFGNRLLAIVMEVVGIALLVAVKRAGAPRTWVRLAWVQALVVPMQAVLGGLLVLSGLNPYVLVLHFLVSFPLVLGAAALLHRVLSVGSPVVAPPRRELRLLAAGLVASTAAVLVVGTLVTGTGPHAGDPKVERMPFNPRDITQLHADLVWLLVGLTIATAVAARALDAPKAVRQGTTWLIGLITAQAVLGYVQYATKVPAALVSLHVLGAGLVFATASWVLLSTGSAQPRLAPRRRSAPLPRVRAAGTATAR